MVSADIHDEVEDKVEGSGGDGLLPPASSCNPDPQMDKDDCMIIDAHGNANGGETGRDCLFVNTLNNLSNINLPLGRRRRGRPRQLEKSLNIKFGQKKRRAEDIENSGGVKHRKTKVDSSICHICLKDEPLKSLMQGSSIICWTECEGNCRRWCHNVCNDWKNSYTCSNCKK